jgi:hypothetical protein
MARSRGLGDVYKRQAKYSARVLRKITFRKTKLTKSLT